MRKGKTQVIATVGKKKYICTITVTASGQDSTQNTTTQEDATQNTTVVPGQESTTASKEEETENRKLYSYTITPLLAPFNLFFYVHTEDPDPSDIRFYDKDTVYHTDTSSDYLVLDQYRYVAIGCLSPGNDRYICS
ncbi:MAG: hypothetical protein Q4B70_07400 [Lachnospiraceae bacterium]|nr:hypothetical protein [Lachnospiraceae bacterium]